MSDYRFSIGDYVQLTPGEAPPEDWAILFYLEGEDATIWRGDHKEICKLTDLYPIEAIAYKEAVQAEFRDFIFNQRSLIDIWNDPRFPA